MNSPIVRLIVVLAVAQFSLAAQAEEAETKAAVGDGAGAVVVDGAEPVVAESTDEPAKAAEVSGDADSASEPRSRYLQDQPNLTELLGASDGTPDVIFDVVLTEETGEEAQTVSGAESSGKTDATEEVAEADASEDKAGEQADASEDSAGEQADASEDGADEQADKTADEPQTVSGAEGNGKTDAAEKVAEADASEDGAGEQADVSEEDAGNSIVATENTEIVLPTQAESIALCSFLSVLANPNKTEGEKKRAMEGAIADDKVIDTCREALHDVERFNLENGTNFYVGGYAFTGGFELNFIPAFKKSWKWKTRVGFRGNTGIAAFITVDKTTSMGLRIPRIAFPVNPSFPNIVTTPGDSVRTFQRSLGVVTLFLVPRDWFDKGKVRTLSSFKGQYVGATVDVAAAQSELKSRKSHSLRVMGNLTNPGTALAQYSMNWSNEVNNMNLSTELLEVDFIREEEFDSGIPLDAFLVDSIVPSWLSWGFNWMFSGDEEAEK